MNQESAKLNYVASSKKLKFSADDLDRWARWLAVTPHRDRPLPKGQSGYVVDTHGLRLIADGFKDQHWHPGMAHRRIKIGHDSLVQVMNLSERSTVLDCTLGMGHDTLVMANAGANIHALEREPGLLIYTMLGIHQWSADHAKRITAQCCDFRNALLHAPSNSVDHVYMDPMFPRSKFERKSVTWAILRRILEPNARISVGDLEQALRVTRQCRLEAWTR